MQQLPPGFQLDGGQPAPAPNRAPGIIQGRPRAPDPVQLENLDRQNRAEGRQEAQSTFRTMAPDEASAAGLPAGGVYQVNGLGEIKTVRAAPNAAEAAKSQTLGSRQAKLRGLIDQLDRAEQIYLDEIKGGLPNPISGRLLPFTEGNSRFGAAASSAAQQAFSAFRVPGEGPQSDADLKLFVEANRPLPTDTEATIEEKFRSVRARALAELEAFGDEAEQPDGAGAVAANPPAIQEQDRRFGAGMDGGDSRDQIGLATGEARREDNPSLSGVRGEYARRLNEGQSAEEIIRWARSAGIDPSAFPSIQEQVRFRQQNPDVPIEQYDTTQLDDRFVPVSGFDQAMTAAAQSPLGSYAIAAGDAASGFTLDNIVGMTGGNAERARLGMGVLAEQNPVSSALGTVSGGVMTALGGEAALGAGLGMRAGMGRALAADSAYGALAGAGSTDDGSSRIAGAAMGGAAGLGGSYAGQRAGNALRGVAQGTGNPAVNTLRREGVNNLTVGQAVGGSGRAGEIVKGAEDRLSGVPVIGDMINARRSEGLRKFNQAAFRKALEPIGGDVGDKVGQDAIEEAQNQVSKAYRDALSGVGVVPDDEFSKALSSSLMGIQSLKRVGPEIFDDVVDILRAYDGDAMLSGEAIDVISRDLRTLKFAYKQDPRFNAIGKQIDRVERAIFDLADRQASGKVPEYMAARRAYRRLSTLEDAVLKAQNQTDNVFTPAQLGQADRANTKRFGGKRAAARGDTPFNELQQAGQEVLPNRVPDSGTAGRLLIPLVALSAGGASDASGQTNGAGLTIGGIVAALYSRTGQRLLTKPARGMEPGTRRRAIMESQNTARALGAAGGAGSAAALTGPQ